MDKILSIIVPTYNMEKYLERCLSSLIVSDEQMAMLEVLVINDGSKDRSSEIAHGYESRYPDTFRVIDKTNGHYGSCVNRGLQEATGKYVKVLDADDWFNTENFAEYINYLAENDCDLIISESCILGENDSIRGIWKYPLTQSTIYDIKDFPLFSDGYICHQILAYNRHLLLNIAYSQTEGIPYTDLEWVCKPMTAVKSLVYFPKLIYVYQQDREGQSVSPENHCRDIWMEQNVIKKLVDLFETLKDGIPEKNLNVIRMIIQSDIKGIYFHYLLDYPKALPNDNLISFDNEILNESPELYYGVSDAYAIRKKIRIRYIEEWRKNKTRKTFKFRYLDVCDTIMRIKA